MGSKNISLIIVTCKKYNDVLTVLMDKLDDISFFSIPFDKVYLATDNICDDVDYNKLNIDEVLTGEGWGQRVRSALKKVDTKYCMVLLDDYIPYKSVRTEDIFNIIGLNQDFDCVYLSSVFSDIKKGKEINGLNGYRELPDDFLYKVNTTAGIWKVKSLLNILSDDDSPWEWEAFAGLGKRCSLMKFAAPEDELSQAYFYSYKTGGAVYRGEWVYDALIDIGCTDDFILNLTGRSIIKKMSNSKRSFFWKMKFLYRGYNKIGFRVLKFMYCSYIKKIKKDVN